jgi:putative membrane-bound dehydrogenase-like protein
MKPGGRGGAQRLATAWAAMLVAGSAACGQGLSPRESVDRMVVPEGLQATLVAGEPLVRQPVAIEFDDRGRLWVIQYLQYPNPEGLRRVEVDRYSRTTYDRVPEPPPRGPRGADRITILEDTDGDGCMDRGHDFVAGLNLATGLAFGHGGVFVLQVPYLLFYPDRDRDDVPDGDPEVLLEGFGMDDAHSVANSLTWGPDGWLYGCQGSTVTARIRGIEFQQGVWRYHPRTREFELFCEGGGNAWGLDFDRCGRMFYSTNYGGYRLVHGVQGAYYVKSFGKHGPLHNPHTYGYFEHAPHTDFRGGHVTVGGIVYQADTFPEAFRDTYIAGDLLGHAIYWHAIRPHGSTVATAHGGELLTTSDTWFAPTDVTVGPDGAVYVADWHDARTAHPDPDADWDRTNGRIIRIAPAAMPGRPAVDFTRCSPEELRAFHADRSQWHVRRARAELARRMGTRAGPLPPELLPVRVALQATATDARDETAAVEALWSLHTLDGLSAEVASRLLASPHAAVRAWTIRLVGDGRSVSPSFAHELDALAEREPDVEVLLQLAATAARLPAAAALPIVNAAINRDDHGDDPWLPLMWWWAVERHAIGGREEVMRRFVRPTLWASRLGRDMLLPRLLRRYTAEGTAAGLDCVARLLAAAPDVDSRRPLWPAVLAGWRERPAAAAGPSPELAAALLTDWRAWPDDLALLELAVVLGLPEPVALATREAFDEFGEPGRRAALLGMLGATGDPAVVEPARALLSRRQPEAVRAAAVRLLATVSDPGTADPLIREYLAAPADPVAAVIVDAVLSRPEWALAWLEAVDRGEIPAATIPLETIRRTGVFADARIDAVVARHWGRLEPVTREETLAEVRRLTNDLRAGAGDASAGRELFRTHCANCHRLFGEGAAIGPDLTTANRQDREFLLVSLVDPDSVIRHEYVSVVVQMRDGRVFTGLPVARAGGSLVLADPQGRRQELAEHEIETLEESPVSLMPRTMYRQFSPTQLRDLFAYLQSSP